MKYIFIVNARAGKGTAAKIVGNINRVCTARGLDFEIRLREENKSCYDIAMEYKKKDYVLYVVGGDGTLAVTLPAIVGTKNKLGIMPAGSGNDTYRTVKNLPDGENKIDIGKVNDVYFINVACSGIDAEVGHNKEKFKNTIIPKSQVYNASIVYTFFKYKCRNVKLKTDVKSIDSKYTILSICNGAYYGGGYNIAPKSDLTDGMFDIYFAEAMPKYAMIPLILKLKNGRHEGKRRVHKYRTDHVELEFDEDVMFNVDGEKIVDSKFIIDILPKELTLYNDKELVEEIFKI